MTSVFGSVDRENSVMDHSSDPLELVLDHMKSTVRTMAFWSESAAMNL